MNKRDQVKSEIKQDIIDNLDEIVQKIYDIINDTNIAPTNTEEIAENIFMIVREMDISRQEKDKLDIFLGKEPHPPPKENNDGSVDVYSEIDISNICSKIKIANDIFTTDYSYVYKKGDKYNDIPESIKSIINAYRMALQYEKNKMFKELDNSRSWIISVSLVGSVRWAKKANSPYFLDSEIESMVRKFMKNIETLNSLISGDKSMSDPNKTGLALFDVYNSYSTRNIKFSKRKK